MKEFVNRHKLWFIFAGFLVFFLVYTLLVKFVDVKPTGVFSPKTGDESYVGFATMNLAFRDLVGQNFTLYDITDWGSIITIPIGTIFLIVGIIELVKRKSLLKVDANILALGLFYIADLIVFLMFNFIVINYRPCLIENNGQMYLEPSYPSSTTLLAITLLITCIDQINIYIKKNNELRISLITICVILTAFFVIGRAISGVHWLSDIIGGAILAATLMALYMAMKHSIAKITHQEIE